MECPFKESDRGEGLVGPGADGQVRAGREEELGGQQQVQHHSLVPLKGLI